MKIAENLHACILKAISDKNIHLLQLNHQIKFGFQKFFQVVIEWIVWWSLIENKTYGIILIVNVKICPLKHKSDKLTSLHGEKSNSKLHKTDEATLITSSSVPDFNADITGSHNLTSWKVVRSCWTERERLNKHCSAADCSDTFTSWWIASCIYVTKFAVLSTIWNQKQSCPQQK